jgi:peptidoglycan/xylan/chitin deacetylase (PgdA/CDA1 family)
MLPDRRSPWRRRTKDALAATISHAQHLPFVASLARARRGPLILGYHRVVEDFAESARTDMPSMLIGREMFERHIEWLARDFRFVSLDEIAAQVESGEPFTDRVAAITFDDGYRDVYEQAYPFLKRKGIPAAMFVVTRLVGRSLWQIHDRLYYLAAKAFARWRDPRRELLGLLDDLDIPAADILRSSDALRTPMLTVSALLPSLPQDAVNRVMAQLESVVGNGAKVIPASVTWDMLADMHRHGFIIGSHTRTHLSLPVESKENAREELVGSKRDLEDQLGAPVLHFAYPGGQFTAAVVQAIADAGYRYAYTACPHNDPRYPALTMERLLLWEGSSVDGSGRFSPALLTCQAHDLWPPARRCERVHHT